MVETATGSLSLFSPVKGDYNPNVDWLDGLFPAHPLFDEADQIYDIVTSLKAELMRNILHGCQCLLRKNTSLDIASGQQLLESTRRHTGVWTAMISIQKYGVIYLANRAECRESFYEIFMNNLELAKEIDSFLAYDFNAIRAINYAVHSWVNDGKCQLKFPGRLVPPKAISSIASRHLAIRACDFQNSSSESLLDETSVFWDLHDFAHQTTATLSSPLYGSKYFTDLVRLPAKATSLIRSPGLRTAKGPRISDGIIFSEFLTGLFTAEIERFYRHHTRYTYADLENILATAVAAYLLAERALLHPSSGQNLQLDQPIQVYELAILVQNKAYELTASEIEQRVFTRGGPIGDNRDELEPMTAGERLKFLAGSSSWLYFEVRNTVKHRAHKEAYAIVARKLLERAKEDKEIWLCHAIIENLEYKNWKSSGTPNLWAILADLHEETDAKITEHSWPDFGMTSDSTRVEQMLGPRNIAI